VLYSWRIIIIKYSQPTAVTKYEKPVTTTRVVTLVTLGGLLQVREDWEEHLPCKSSSCTPSLKDSLARHDGEQSICRQLNTHAASGRPRNSASKAVVKGNPSHVVPPCDLDSMMRLLTQS
jgi:hypothetical protein